MMFFLCVSRIGANTHKTGFRCKKLRKKRSRIVSLIEDELRQVWESMKYIFLIKYEMLTHEHGANVSEQRKKK